MSESSRYTVAIHILVLLAYGSPERMTSAYIAGSVNTNPVVIRRLLAFLRKARLVTSQGGPGGGWQLLRSAQAITLRDVYRAVEKSSLFAMHRNPPNLQCPVGKNIQRSLEKHFDQAQLALEDRLAQTSIAMLVEDVKRKAGG